MLTLAELGYARTSLREIAANSPYSHGVVHYYFRDKTELILHGVRAFKARCVTRYDDVVSNASSADGLREAFAEKLVETMIDEAPMHRLWYDLRNQSMFDEALRADVLAIDASLEQMIWRVISRYAELAGRSPRVTPAAAYAMLDGVFQRALLRHICSEPPAEQDLREQTLAGLPPMLNPVDTLD